VTNATQRHWLRPRIPDLIAWLVRAVAVFTVVNIALPEHHLRHGVLSEARDVVGDGISFATAIASAGMLLLLANALSRRKRRAWATASVVLAASAAANLWTHQMRVVAVTFLLLLVLLVSQKEFQARSERSSRLAAVRVFLVMAGLSMVSGVLLTQRTAPASSLASRIPEVFFGLLGFTPELVFRRAETQDLTETALISMGVLTTLVTLIVLLAPARQASLLGADDEDRLREMLTKWGDRDSLGYFALRRDKTVIFSPSGKAAVAYRVIGGVSLAAGDPLGDPEAWPGAIAAWLEEARGYAWTTGVIGASEEAAVVYRRAGFDALELGDEAVVDVKEFSLDGRSMRVVRQAVNRTRRAGYTAEIGRQVDLTAEELKQVEDAVERFRGEEVERGFSMALGRLGDPSDPDLVIARARDGQDTIIAVLVFVPWGKTGLSLDVMRRSRDSENGTVEFVVTEVIEAAACLGITRISLNFAVFRSVFERGSRVGAGPILRLWHRLLLFASKWWQIESLYRANAKYQPVWEPRFICFRRAGDLPRLGLAALEAEAFVQMPRLRWLAR
jgi:lysyl-tRNA synthetase class 2